MMSCQAKYLHLRTWIEPARNLKTSTIRMVSRHRKEDCRRRLLQGQVQQWDQLCIIPVSSLCSTDCTTFQSFNKNLNFFQIFFTWKIKIYWYCACALLCKVRRHRIVFIQFPFILDYSSFSHTFSHAHSASSVKPPHHKSMSLSLSYTYWLI